MVRGLFYVHHRLFTLDGQAVNHIMSQPYLYEKPMILRKLLKRYMKDGLISAVGQRHKLQRKVVSKLFSAGAMRDMIGVIEEKSNQVSQISGQNT